MKLLETIPVRKCYTAEDVRNLLDADFDSALTIIRLFLELSKDEFTFALQSQGRGGMGINRYKEAPEKFLDDLERLNLVEIMNQTANRPTTWRDLIIERLKVGRGSAIKGQSRGRYVEDLVENIVKCTFDRYDLRCRFTSATGESTEKADFAIPSKEDPSILIEVKAYGATGSKQTDILGDISRIGDEKRNDTDLLLVVDGITWKARMNDLRKLINLQNQGKITRIYTLKMAPELKKDLKQLKSEHGL